VVGKENMDSYDEIISKILTTSFTKTDINRRMRLLREYLEQVYFKSEKMDTTKFLISRQATTDDIDVFLNWGDNFFKNFNQENIYKIITRISDVVKKMPVITIYIPYEPVPAEIIKLGRWCRKNITEGVIVDLKTEPTLLRGCALVWKGMYRDYSLRYYMMKKRGEIERVLEEYVKKFYKE